MSDREAIYKALFDALLELREAGAESKDKRVWHLANLFHHLPHWLNDLDQGEATPAEVARRLRERAEDAGVGRWLDAHMPQPDERPAREHRVARPTRPERSPQTSRSPVAFDPTPPRPRQQEQRRPGRALRAGKGGKSDPVERRARHR